MECRGKSDSRSNMKCYLADLTSLSWNTLSTLQPQPGRRECSCSVYSLSLVQLFVNLWTAACQASLSITNSRSLLKLIAMESVMPFNHLILCHPLLLLPSIFPSIRAFSSVSSSHQRPKYWSFSLSISPSNEYPGQISFRTAWIDLLEIK